ncbi:SRPBCC family protein [Streptomyces sp. NBC_01089]|uniref:SRPBCC family protein n=1 Tax=Streptomyces sp. NBC_01089 TaxID=2903747 RepID=UPI00386AE141|nr:SRPBCC family protein [Streptomyces sp. NBC_01089]
MSEESPLFELRTHVKVSAAPDDVYAVVSDLPRSGEWSSECLGGEWISGEPATVGAVFSGENLRDEKVVAWAPVVRGKWTTQSEIVAAEPGHTFRWAMRDTSGNRQESVWGFDIEPADGGCTLTHHFRMDKATEGIRGIVAEMDEQQKRRFFTEWGAKVESDMTATLSRVKAVIDKG